MSDDHDNERPKPASVWGDEAPGEGATRMFSLKMESWLTDIADVDAPPDPNAPPPPAAGMPPPAAPYGQPPSPYGQPPAPAPFAQAPAPFAQAPAPFGQAP